MFVCLFNLRHFLPAYGYIVIIIIIIIIVIIIKTLFQEGNTISTDKQLISLVALKIHVIYRYLQRITNVHKIELI